LPKEREIHHEKLQMNGGGEGAYYWQFIKAKRHGGEKQGNVPKKRGPDGQKGDGERKSPSKKWGKKVSIMIDKGGDRLQTGYIRE